jgi:hypothetical protein
MSTANAQSETSNEERAMDAIRRRARELADDAPPLTSEQMVLLKSVFSHQSGAADARRRDPGREQGVAWLGPLRAQSRCWTSRSAVRPSRGATCR